MRTKSPRADTNPQINSSSLHVRAGNKEVSRLLWLRQRDAPSPFQTGAGNDLGPHVLAMGIGTRGKRVWLLIDHARCGGIDHKVYTTGDQRCNVSYNAVLGGASWGMGARPPQKMARAIKQVGFRLGNTVTGGKLAGTFPFPPLSTLPFGLSPPISPAHSFLLFALPPSRTD